MLDKVERRKFLKATPAATARFFVFVCFFLMLAGVAFAQNEGEKYVLDSLKMLLVVRTIESDILIETYVDGKEYAATGHYKEQTLPKATPESFLRSMYRLEINFPMNVSTAGNSKPNRMTLICHPSEDRGKNQITCYTCIEGDETFRTVDLAKVEARLKAANNKPVFAQVSEIRSFGGLAGTMRQICQFYEFAAPIQENLHDEKTVATWKLTGTLRSQHHKDFLEKFGGLDKNEHNPTDFPSDIEIWLGRHNDFPYKIRYLRRTSEESSQKTLLFQKSFYKVNVDGTPIPESKFAPLTPPEGVFSIQDDTENFIKTLGL